MGRSTLLCSTVNMIAVLSVICRARAKRRPRALICLLSDIQNPCLKHLRGRLHAEIPLVKYGRPIHRWEGNYSFRVSPVFLGVFTAGGRRIRRPLQPSAGLFMIHGSWPTALSIAT